MAPPSGRAPTVPACPCTSPPIPEYDIGYQYLGGISSWLNPAGRFDSYSPVKVSTARSTWCLAADSICKIDGTWGQPQGTARDDVIYSNTPQHRRPGSSAPEGGNEVFIDGSARWIKFQQMYYLTTWTTDGTRIYYFYQESLPDLINTPTVLSQLKARYLISGVPGQGQSAVTARKKDRAWVTAGGAASRLVPVVLVTVRINTQATRLDDS